MKKNSLSVLTLSILLVSSFALSACLAQDPKDDSSKSSAITTSKTCETACENYKNQCLKLVPGATQQLFEEGIKSCMQECAEWPESKASCIATTLDCASMTSVCEL